MKYQGRYVVLHVDHLAGLLCLPPSQERVLRALVEDAHGLDALHLRERTRVAAGAVQIRYSRSELAKRCHLAPSTVQTALEALVDSALVAVKTGTGGRPSEYTVSGEHLERLARLSQERAEPLTGHRSEPDPMTDYRSEHTPATGQSDSGFLREERQEAGSARTGRTASQERARGGRRGGQALCPSGDTGSEGRTGSISEGTARGRSEYSVTKARERHPQSPLPPSSLALKKPERRLESLSEPLDGRVLALDAWEAPESPQRPSERALGASPDRDEGATPLAAIEHEPESVRTLRALVVAGMFSGASGTRADGVTIPNLQPYLERLKDSSRPDDRAAFLTMAEVLVLPLERAA